MANHRPSVERRRSLAYGGALRFVRLSMASSWDTSIWRDSKANGARLAGSARIQGRKGSGDSVIVEFAFDREEDD